MIIQLLSEKPTAYQPMNLTDFPVILNNYTGHKGTFFFFHYSCVCQSVKWEQLLPQQPNGPTITSANGICYVIMKRWCSTAQSIEWICYGRSCDSRWWWKLDVRRLNCVFNKSFFFTAAKGVCHPMCSSHLVNTGVLFFSFFPVS